MFKKVELRQSCYVRNSAFTLSCYNNGVIRVGSGIAERLGDYVDILQEGDQFAIASGSQRKLSKKPQGIYQLNSKLLTKQLLAKSRVWTVQETTQDGDTIFILKPLDPSAQNMQ